jgi:hypothetical protein
MLPLLLGGVGLISGLLFLKGRDFILLVPIGSFLLQLMGGFLLTPLMGGFLLQLMGGILLMPLMGGFLLQLMGGFLLMPPIPLGGGFSSLASTAKHWCAFTLPGGIPPDVPLT